MNKIIVIGNVTKDLELRYTSENKPVATLSLAINNGKDDTTFIDFGVFGSVAENCCKYLVKGSKVAIEGMVKNNNYTDKNGNKVYGFRFLASNVEFLNTKQEQKQEVKQEINSDPFAEFGEQVEIDNGFLD